MINHKQVIKITRLIQQYKLGFVLFMLDFSFIIYFYFLNGLIFVFAIIELISYLCCIQDPCLLESIPCNNENCDWICRFL